MTALLSVVALTCTPEFPVRSSKFIVNDNAPSGSVPSSVLVASPAGATSGYGCSNVGDCDFDVCD